jgi:hypothetical protein
VVRLLELIIGPVQTSPTTDEQGKRSLSALPLSSLYISSLPSGHAILRTGHGCLRLVRDTYRLRREPTIGHPGSPPSLAESTPPVPRLRKTTTESSPNSTLTQTLVADTNCARNKYTIVDVVSTAVFFLPIHSITTTKIGIPNPHPGTQNRRLLRRQILTAGSSDQTKRRDQITQNGEKQQAGRG